MPTKRRFILFLIVLAIMVLVKYAAGQNDLDVGWYQQRDPSLEDYIESTVLAGIFWGSIIGIARVRSRNIAARRGEYFSGDLMCLDL